MTENTASTQEARPRVLATSFEPPATTVLPPFLERRISILSGPIEALENESFVGIGEDGSLPQGIVLVEGMPSLDDLGDHDQVRGVVGTAVLKGAHEGVSAEATAITFRNSQTLSERAFAITYDAVNNERTFMDRTIKNADFKRPATAEEVQLYSDAMAVIGSLATSGCPLEDGSVPSELKARGLSVVVLVEGEHEGGFRYQAPGSQVEVTYVHKENFMTQTGGLGRNFAITIASESVPVANLEGSTVLFLDPRPTPPPVA